MSYSQTYLPPKLHTPPLSCATRTPSLSPFPRPCTRPRRPSPPPLRLHRRLQAWSPETAIFHGGGGDREPRCEEGGGLRLRGRPGGVPGPVHGGDRREVRGRAGRLLGGALRRVARQVHEVWGVFGSHKDSIFGWIGGF